MDDQGRLNESDPEHAIRLAIKSRDVETLQKLAMKMSTAQSSDPEVAARELQIGLELAQIESAVETRVKIALLAAYRDGYSSARVRLAMPPRFLWSGIARMVLSPAGYRRSCEPHIADMHQEYFECISRGDEWGARRAVIRAHLYAVPSWVWSLGAHLVLRLVAWIRA